VKPDLRRKSTIRRAFEAASRGAVLGLAAEVWPGVAPESAAKKASHALGCGPDDTLNAPWQLLDAIAQHDPETLLRCLCAELGYEPPVRLAAPAERSLERAADELVEIRERLDDLAAEVREARGMAKVQPAREQRRRA
jgi:hypothetical protein